MKNLLSSIIMLACMLGYTSCTGIEDDGSRAFADVATIMGDQENGYRCYLGQNLGLVVSHSAELAGKERGYFTFSYMESDWAISADGTWHIENAHVRAIDTYDVVHPLTPEEAASGHSTDKELCTVPKSLTVSYVSGGYVDLSAVFSTFNRESGKTSKGEVNLVYDPTKQVPDSLRLQLYYIPGMPDGWTNTDSNPRTVSCDLSSLSSLLQWNDSLTLVIEDGSKEKHLRKMSKKDLLKPEARVK